MKKNTKLVIIGTLITLLIIVLGASILNTKVFKGRSLSKWATQALEGDIEITVEGMPDDKIIRGPVRLHFHISSGNQITEIKVEHNNVIEFLDEENGVVEYDAIENGSYVMTVRDSEGKTGQFNFSLTQIDNKEPSRTKPELTVTENSITARFKQEDNLGSANSGLTETRRYRITNESGTTGDWVETTEDEYTFTDLDSGAIYYVQTMAVDNVEYASVSEVASTMTSFEALENIVSITRTPADTVEWTKQVVFDIEVIGGVRYRVKTSLDGTSFIETNRQEINSNEITLYGKILCNGVESGVIELDTVENVDVEPPLDTAPTGESTANTVTATFTQTDEKSGIDETTIAYRLLGDSEGQEVLSDWETTGETTKTYTGLRSERNYYIQTKVSDNLGTMQESKIAAVRTEAVVPGSDANISYDHTWTNQDVVVTIRNNNQEFTLQACVGTQNFDGSDAINILPGEEQTVTLEQNNKIYTRFTDGTNNGNVGETVIDNIDKVMPTDTAPTVTATETTLSVTINQTDNEGGSGLGSTQTRLVTSLEGTESLNGYDWSNTEVYRNLIPDTTYYVQSRYTDKAGNTRLSQVREAKTNNIPTTEDKIEIVSTNIGDEYDNWTTKVKLEFTITDPTAIALYTLKVSTDGSNYSNLINNEMELEENKEIYTKFTDGTYTGPGFRSFIVDNIDIYPPTTDAPSGETTEEKITVTNNQVDNECGIDETLTKYRLLVNTNEGQAVARDWQESNEFTGLTANTKYYMQTYSEDHLGNNSVSELKDITTWVVPSIDNLSLSASPAGDWTGGNVIVTANYTKRDFAVQMKIDDGEYITTDSIEVENNNSTVTARFINGDLPGEAETSITIENIDKIPPTTTAPEVVEVTTRKVVLEGTQTDSQSEINKIEYRLLTEVNDETSDDEGWQESEEFDGLRQFSTYYAQTRAEDNVGNVSYSEYTEVTTEIVPEPVVGENFTYSIDPEDWTNQDVTVTATALIDDFDLLMGLDQDNLEKITEVTVSEQDSEVYFRYSDGVNLSLGYYIVIDNIDKIAPNTEKPTLVATKTSIEAEMNQTDEGGSGLDEDSIRYRFVTDETGEEALEGYDWQEEDFFEDLYSDTTYYVQTKVRDNAGNESVSEVAEIVTEEIPNANTYVTYEKTPKEWTNHEVIVTFDNSQPDFDLEYSTDRVNYELMEDDELIISENETIYVRLTNGISSGKEMVIIINNIDKVKPTLSASISEVTPFTITVSATASDGSSGVDKFYYRLVSDKQGTEALPNRDWQESYIFRNLDEETTYYVQIKVIDKAGNEQTRILETTTGTTKTIITSDDYLINEDESIITRVPVYTTLQEFRSKIRCNQEYEIRDTDGEVVTDGNMKTGYTLHTNTADYEIAVIADLSGDGALNIIDLSRMRAHLVNADGFELQGIYFIAADINGNGKVDIVDLARIRAMLVE